MSQRWVRDESEVSQRWVTCESQLSLRWVRDQLQIKRTNNTNHATRHVKLGKKTRESSKRNYYIISPRVIIKTIVISQQWVRTESWMGQRWVRHESEMNTWIICESSLQHTVTHCNTLPHTATHKTRKWEQQHCQDSLHSFKWDDPGRHFFLGRCITDWSEICQRLVKDESQMLPKITVTNSVAPLWRSVCTFENLGFSFWTLQKPWCPCYKVFTEPPYPTVIPWQMLQRLVSTQEPRTVTLPRQHLWLICESSLTNLWLVSSEQMFEACVSPREKRE